jgi:hypothetical protein
MLSKNLIYILLTFGLVLVANYLVYAVFNEPTAMPPLGNTPAPINIGPDTQVKDGVIGVKELIANTAITLGGVRKTAWPAGGVGGAACTWEGTKCDCWDDTSTFTDIKLTIGLTCASGQITDFGIKELDVTSRTKDCRDNPPSGCTAGLYTHTSK